MSKIVRIPINNVYADGDYTGRVFVGAKKKPMNVLLDTGSSAFALNVSKYRPAAGDKTTRLAQTQSYADNSSWTGAVIQTTVSVGDDGSSVTATGINAAIAYKHSRDMFGKTDGILGLAYAPLDDAYRMEKDTWSHRYTARSVKNGKEHAIVPYLMQLKKKGGMPDKFSFQTKRSLVHRGGAGADDPLNQGWMIIGGGEESKELYSGKFETVKVLSDEWYSTNLMAISVGDKPVIPVRERGNTGTVSNSIVDSGTNSLVLGRHLRALILEDFTPGQRALLSRSISEKSDNRPISMSRLNLAAWPDIIFILQGLHGDVRIRVRPRDYWQVNAPKVGVATAAITAGDGGSHILGLFHDFRWRSRRWQRRRQIRAEQMVSPLGGEGQDFRSTETKNPSVSVRAGVISRPASDTSTARRKR